MCNKQQLSTYAVMVDRKDEIEVEAYCWASALTEAKKQRPTASHFYMPKRADDKAPFELDASINTSPNYKRQSKLESSPTPKQLRK